MSVDPPGQIQLECPQLQQIEITKGQRENNVRHTYGLLGKFDQGLLHGIQELWVEARKCPLGSIVVVYNPK